MAPHPPPPPPTATAAAAAGRTTQPSTNMNSTRKRPSSLLKSTSRRSLSSTSALAPLPQTATWRRLEAMLDKEEKINNKNKSRLQKKKQQHLENRDVDGKILSHLSSKRPRESSSLVNPHCDAVDDDLSKSQKRQKTATGDSSSTTTTRTTKTRGAAPQALPPPSVSFGIGRSFMKPQHSSSTTERATSVVSLPVQVRTKISSSSGSNRNGSNKSTATAIVTTHHQRQQRRTSADNQLQEVHSSSSNLNEDDDVNEARRLEPSATATKEYFNATKTHINQVDVEKRKGQQQQQQWQQQLENSTPTRTKSIRQHDESMKMSSLPTLLPTRRSIPTSSCTSLSASTSLGRIGLVMTTKNRTLAKNHIPIRDRLLGGGSCDSAITELAGTLKPSVAAVRRQNQQCTFNSMTSKESSADKTTTTTTTVQRNSSYASSSAIDDESAVLLPPPTTTSSSSSSCRGSLLTSSTMRSRLSDTSNISKNTDDFVSPITKSTLNMNKSAMPSSASIKKKGPPNNDNFVRLNLKNNAGACRGASKKKKSLRNVSRRYQYHRGEDDEEDADNYDRSSVVSASTTNDELVQLLDRQSRPPERGAWGGSFHGFNAKSSYGRDEDNISRKYDSDTPSRTETTIVKDTRGSLYSSKMTGLDPLDEFIDGQFHMTGNDKIRSACGQHQSNRSEVQVPKCTRHQLPCKLIAVTKNTTGNKGRKFFACSMPRGEQCNHFQWADDTIESARDVIANNTSHSSFISRQVASHVDRFRMLTVPELRDELGRRNLNKNGKKQQLLMRLAIWARDEIVKSSSELQDNSDNQNESTNVEKRLKVIQENDSFSYDCSDDDDSDDDDDESCSSGSSSAEELEFWDGSSAVSTASTNPTETPSTDTADEENDSLLGYLRCIFGYDNFRDGQEWAIERCLAGNRSLLIAPTGFGKSLCYALPAAMMEGVCIVVSPLISLMQDQLRSLPPRIPAATLSGSVSASMTAAILDDVARKRIKILFVSPERLTSPAFQRLFIKTWNPTTKMRERRFPSISLLCVDEAHTISQWGHNFRPCFIRVRNLVKIMEPKSILAITATAGPKVIEDIQATLDIAVAPESSESTRIISKGRDNIDVMCKFAENHEDRLNMLQKILMPRTKLSEEEQIRHPYAGSMATGSVIIYVWRKIDTEVLAENLTAAGVSGGIVVYHGGMDAHSRSRSQSRFMRGKARICVATVAFGLGIDKADIEGIIHLYLSNSPEHFLQEIGRAGRDGRPAKAIALPLSEEVPIRHSLVHSTLVSKSQIRVLLEILRNLVVAAGSEDCEARKEDPSGIIHIGVPIQSTVFACDFKSETLETFLSLIELVYEEEPVLIVEGFNYNSATIALKKRPLQKLAEREPVAKSILEVAQCVDPPISSSSTQKERITEQPINNSAFQKQFLAYSLGSYHFSITDCANHLGPTAEPRHIFAAMRRLQASNELEFALDTSETGRVCHVKVTSKGASAFYGDAFETMEENLTSKLYESFSSSNCSAAKKVLDMHYILSEVAKVSSVIDMQPRTKSRSLSRFQELMQRYFDDVPMTDNPEGSTSSNTLPIIFSDVRDKELEIDAHSLVRDLPYCTTGSRNEKTKEAVAVGNTDMIDYTVLAISKFLHGIDTPRCPSRNFRSHALFGKWRAANFSLVLEAVQKALSSGPRMITANHFDG